MPLGLECMHALYVLQVHTQQARVPQVMKHARICACLVNILGQGLLPVTGVLQESIRQVSGMVRVLDAEPAHIRQLQE